MCVYLCARACAPACVCNVVVKEMGKAPFLCLGQFTHSEFTVHKFVKLIRITHVIFHCKRVDWIVDSELYRTQNNPGKTKESHDEDAWVSKIYRNRRLVDIHQENKATAFSEARTERVVKHSSPSPEVMSNLATVWN